jgi:hypothetical protein
MKINKIESLKYSAKSGDFAASYKVLLGNTQVMRKRHLQMLQKVGFCL